LPAASRTPFDEASWSATLLEGLTPYLAASGRGQALPGAELSWEAWLRRHFPHVCASPFGERHVRLWDWFERLAPGERPRARVEVWPRGGAKSTTTELGCVRCCVRLSRRYALYVSETQEQADKHIAAIASLLESCGVARAVNQYGTAKGWRRQELRTANGFNVSAYGLDTAARGVKLDQYRPDLVIFDDIDSQDDSAKTTEKKIAAITTAIIPAGSADCAILFLQNLIHEESIFSQLVDGRADFLRDREPAVVEPAVRGLETETYDGGEGLQVYRITAGAATWEGQNLATCERQINDWGLRAFLREAQHEVAGASGYFFDVTQLKTIEPHEVPTGLRKCRGWDLAGTEGGGDHTAGPLLGVDGFAPALRCFVLDVKRGQWGSDRVHRNIGNAVEADGETVKLRLPQDPGQAGKDQAQRLQREFPGAIIRPVTGNKATRAAAFADCVNGGNCYLVRAPWNPAFREELRKFKEDESHEADDQVDGASDAFNELAARREWAFG
jgi:predicted phage terminase large subunit-like protein